MSLRDGNFLRTARITLEAKSPLMIASGEASLEHDVMLARDPNGLPMIPARSFTGALRDAVSLDEDVETDLFGEKTDHRKAPKPGRIALSDGLAIGLSGFPIDGLKELPEDLIFDFLLQEQPIHRDHVRLSSNGVVSGDGKFTRAACPRGTRFLVSIEAFGAATDKNWQKLLENLPALLRLGGAKRSGYGIVRISHIEVREFDMASDTERSEAIKSQSLSEPLIGTKITPKTIAETIEYSFKLLPDGAFRFGQGNATGEDDADLRPLKEAVISYHANAPQSVVTERYFAPASSIKGALRHRTAFHLRRRSGAAQWFVDDFDESAKPSEAISVEDNRINESIAPLFGMAKEGHDDEIGKAGCLFIDDIPLHNLSIRRIARTTIDRFSGGSIRGRLFTEDFIDLEKPIEFHCQIESSVPEELLAAFEDALNDVCSGRLSLGAGGNKGLGAFLCDNPPNAILERQSKRDGS